MTSKIIRRGSAAFRPRARVIKALGEDLIPDDNTAVIELVKNSYDASARKVTVRLVDPSDVRTGAIEVIDDGHGMSLDTVLTTWMEPAVAAKRAGKAISRTRRTLGEKGLGRFAAAKLGDTLQLISRVRGESTEVMANFDWSKWNTGDKYLEEVKCDWLIREPEELDKPGTIIRVSGLRHPWGIAEARELRNSLARLVNPLAKVSGFSIVLDVPEELSDVAGPIGVPETIESPHYMITGEIDRAGKTEYTLDVRDKETEKKEDWVCQDGKPPECGPLKFHIRVWDRDPDEIQKLADELGVGPRQVRIDLNRMSGIAIIRDEFRVLPYGDPSFDWLGLDLRRVNNPTLRVSNNQVVGYVFLSAVKNPNLRDQTNRQGLIASQAFEDLKEMVIKALSILEVERSVWRRSKKEAGARTEGLFVGFSMEDLQRLVLARYPQDQELQKAVGAKAELLERKVEETKNVVSRYRRLASIGYLVDLTLHETGARLGKITAEANWLAGQARQHRTPSWEDLKARSESIVGNAEALGQLFRKLAPLSPGKTRKPEIVALRTVIEDAFRIYQEKLTEAGVKWEIVGAEPQLRVVRGEVQQIFTNLIDNSIYWLTSPPRLNPKIMVVIEASAGTSPSVLFSDNGPGVPDEIGEQIWDPYFSTKPNGTGLGLTIAGEAVSETGGRIELLAEGPLQGACFRIVFGQEVMP